MHTKNYDGFEIYFSGPDLHREEIDSLMSFLHHQLEGIDNYSDKSLFFQNPHIFEGWLGLVRAIEKIETWVDIEDDTKWEDRTETYVEYLLTLRDYYFKYEDLYHMYYEQLNKILDCYGGWLEGECISADGIEALSADQYEEYLEDVDDIIQYSTKLNSDSLKARSAVHSVLTDIFQVLLAVMGRGMQILIFTNPSFENFAKAISDDLREWTLAFGKRMFKEMKEDLNRYYKAHRTDNNTPELWSEMLDAEENALFMAKRQELANCDDEKQEHWGEDMKKKMDENCQLMQQIYLSCRTEELFDLGQVDNSLAFFALLTPHNLDMFYEIIVRRNLIQCEMFPNLKAQHELWLNKGNEQEEEFEQITPIETSDCSNNISELEEGIQKEPPQKCIDAINNLLKPDYTINSSVFNSRVQLQKAVGEIDLGANAQIGVLLAICKEVGVVKPNTGNTDFLRILIGLGFISYVDDDQIKRIAHGFSQKIKKLPSKHTQWSGNDRTLGDKIYDALRQG